MQPTLNLAAGVALKDLGEVYEKDRFAPGTDAFTVLVGRHSGGTSGTAGVSLVPRGGWGGGGAGQYGAGVRVGAGGNLR